MGAELEVIVHIDRALGLSVTKQLRGGSTIRDLKEELAGDDPTGQAHAWDFCLLGRRPADPTGRYCELDDSLVITAALAEVEVRVGPPPEEGPAPSDAQEAVDPDQSLQNQAIWEVVGGEGKGGIMVREGIEFDSPKMSSRLSTGALVAEVALVSERLHYSLLEGAGPASGWVSLAFNGKALLHRTERRPAKTPAGKSDPPPQGRRSQPQTGKETGRGAAKSVPAEPRTIYELLDIPVDATDAAINSAFRKMSLKVHPDHCPDDPDANAKFLRLTEAKNVLLDPVARRRYDLTHGINQAQGVGTLVQPATDEEPLTAITLYRELGIAERLGVVVTDPATNAKSLLPLNLFASTKGLLRLGALAMELAKMIGVKAEKLACDVTLEAVCEGEDMPQLLDGAGDEEEEEMGDAQIPDAVRVRRGVVEIANMHTAIGRAPRSWLLKNNSMKVLTHMTNQISSLLEEAGTDDTVLRNALETAMSQTNHWWGQGDGFHQSGGHKGSLTHLVKGTVFSNRMGSVPR